MVMGEKLLMLKCKPKSYICTKRLLCGLLKFSDEKTISIIIQMHDGKTMLKRLSVYKLTGHKSFPFHDTCTWFAFFFRLNLMDSKFQLQISCARLRSFE
jgi:hypothetical protein